MAPPSILESSPEATSYINCMLYVVLYVSLGTGLGAYAQLPDDISSNVKQLLLINIGMCSFPCIFFIFYVMYNWCSWASKQTPRSDTNYNARCRTPSRR